MNDGSSEACHVRVALAGSVHERAGRGCFPTAQVGGVLGRQARSSPLGVRHEKLPVTGAVASAERRFACASSQIAWVAHCLAAWRMLSRL